ncbi:MAG: hypothetical protein U1C49_02310, partial [Candidatus Andersenbacteria bacterium]|nr:hypothetical protein [Candidatus Andersenbacteria bacterium]
MPSYQEYRKKNNEYGVIEELRHPLAYVQGLPGSSLGEMVIIENEAIGQITALNDDYVEVLILSPVDIVPGMEVARCQKQLSIAVGPHLRGHAINPLGESLFADQPISVTQQEERVIDITPPHIKTRRTITKPFYTGTSVIDLLLPLAQGQREAILGDPTTGKSSFLLTTIRNHAETGIVVYAAIGKPWNDIKKMYNYIVQNAKKENIILVAASAEDIISNITITPFTAMTIAEYWRDQGENVLVVFDDLSSHAKFYREIGLLARRFPARESYPGDIFYLHARLLERGGNFFHPTKKQEVSITCLPVVETVKEDFTGYIVSNIISITDGHLFFDENIFSQGRRPAINVPLSVTRLGGHTQTALTRQLNRKLIVLMNKHAEAQSYTHFGAELPENMQRILDAGDCLLNFLSQPL